MALDITQSKDVDLDRTDRLPILEGVTIDRDVEDDAVRLEHTAALPSPVRSRQIPLSDDVGSAAVNAALRTESVRPAAERSTRQSAEYGALSRLYEKAREAEAVGAARAEALLAELSAAHAALTAEQHRSREMQRELAERDALDEAASVVAAGARAERSALESAIAERDTTIAQLQHSLAERDAQLNALQREHAKTVPALEAQLNGQLETVVKTERGRGEELAAELKTMQQSLAALTVQLQHADNELRVTRGELGTVKGQAETYLETLRTREFRRGFDENLSREREERLAAAAPANPQAVHEAFEISRPIAEIPLLSAEIPRSIVEIPLPSAESPRLPAEVLDRLDTLEAEHNRLENELAARDQALVEAAQTHEDELTVLMAHLNEARRPVQTMLADVERLRDELSLKTSAIEELTEDNRSLRTALDRTRVALEEREFLIRRVERNESTNVNGLGRLQTTIERLGGAPQPNAAPALATECSAELIRIDGGRNIVFPVSRRTRIGRAPACEMQIDSTSVSRHHALLLKSARELIIEDLNSTNGVLVNGRKISRQLLKDGDLLSLGEVQLRCSLRAVPPGSGADRG